MAKKKAKQANGTSDTPTLPIVEKVEYVGENRFRVSADLLSIAPENMRHEHKFDPALAASIKAHGLINPLICRSIVPGDCVVARYLVVDGGRRWMAISGAIFRGDLPQDYLVDIFVNNDAGKEISLAANQYLQAHPLDRCEAILELAKTEDDEVRLAAAFGMSKIDIKRFARLAELSDAAKAAYRAQRMDLGTAQLMTRLSAKQQDRLCKGRDRIYEQMVRQEIAGTGIDSALAVFDWQALYPPEKVQKSLFDDIVLLLDRDHFALLQTAAYNDRIKLLEDDGYTVVRLKDDDYLTQSKYVAYEGRVTKSMKGALSYLVKPRRDGLVMDFTGPVMLRKDAKKLDTVKGGQDKTAEPPKELTAKDFVPVQTEILNGHILTKLRERITHEGAAEPLVQWIVIAHAVETGCRWVDGNVTGGYGGTTQRWNKLAKEHPGEFKEVDEEALAGLTWETFRKMKQGKRCKLYLMAVASLIAPPKDIQTSHLKTMEGLSDIFVFPGEAFFKRWRTSQILDYLKRSGVTKESGGFPIDSKKSSAVSVAVEVARGPGAWQFGISDKEKS